MTLQGIVQGYHGLIATRIMLGLCEAGFFPAASYLVSLQLDRSSPSYLDLSYVQVTTWYCRFEVQRRLSVFYSAAALAGAFSGILAYGISFMVRKTIAIGVAVLSNQCPTARGWWLSGLAMDLHSRRHRYRCGGSVAALDFARLSGDRYHSR